MTKATDRIDVEGLAKLFGLPSWESIEESNMEFGAEAFAQAEREALAEGRSADEIEEAALAAESEARDELYRQWHSGVMKAAESLFDLHALELTPVHESERHPYEFRVTAPKGWETALNEIRKTMDGVGMFDVGRDTREFLAYGPWTVRQAVLVHLGQIAHYPEVYGEMSARRIYESAWR